MFFSIFNVKDGICTFEVCYGHIWNVIRYNKASQEKTAKIAAAISSPVKFPPPTLSVVTCIGVLRYYLGGNGKMGN